MRDSVKKGYTRKTGDFTTNAQIFRLSAVAIVIGVLCAGIAVALLKAIGLITNLCFYGKWSFGFATPTGNHVGWPIIFIPAIGGLIIGLMARYGSEKIRGHGIPEAIEAMLIHDSKVKPRVAVLKPISAAISIGTGGPYGAEGPIIMTGGSVGSLIAQCLHFSPIERRILLVAGAAGGMSATFSAPIASVLFAVELLMFEYRPRSAVPIALASAVADIIRIQIMGAGPLFPMKNLAHVSTHTVVVAAVIGIVGSLLAVLLTWGIYGVEDAFKKLPIHWMWWPAIGGIVVGVGGYFAPRALGVGYDSIRQLLTGQLALTVILGLLVAKTIIWVVSLGSGTSGGILAPILIIGGSLGEVAAKMMGSSHPGLWALLGMSAIFAGVTRTPFTSIVFPLELTHNLGALLPLLITSCIATGISAFILPRSILTEKIARRGLHLTREYGTDPLEMGLVRNFLRLPRLRAMADDSVESVAQAAWAQPGEDDVWIAVEDAAGNLIGAVDLVTLLRASRNPSSAADCLRDLLPETPPVIPETCSVKTALTTMVAAGRRWALVMKDGKIAGVLTTDDLLQLRQHEYHQELARERVLLVRNRSASKRFVAGSPSQAPTQVQIR